MPHTRAAICRLGHIVSRDVEEERVERRCPDCGVEVLSRCVDCNTPVLGPEFTLRQGPPPTLLRVYIGAYRVPESCGRCQRPHPWARFVASETRAG